MGRSFRMQATPALVEMLAHDADREEPPPPALPAPPLEPLVRFQPPAPDWRAEEAERAEQKARDAAATSQDALEPEQDSYPARRRA